MEYVTLAHLEGLLLVKGATIFEDQKQLNVFSHVTPHA